MKIVDLRCAVIGNSPIVRIVTDEGVDGFGEIESSKPYLRPVVEMYRDFLIGEDPTDVERCMLKIRRFAGFKPWGSAVSAIEFALWDVAGKAAGLPTVACSFGFLMQPVADLGADAIIDGYDELIPTLERLGHRPGG